MVTRPKKNPAPLPEIGVVIPYQRLVELLQAAAEVEDCKALIKQLRGEVSALRFNFTQLLELYKTYQD